MNPVRVWPHPATYAEVLARDVAVYVTTVRSYWRCDEVAAGVIAGYHDDFSVPA